MTRGSALECVFLAAGLTAFGIWACLLGPPIQAVITLSALLLCGLVALAWQRFDAGMHPVFLFLALYLLFQGGRLLAFLLPGPPFDPLAIDLADPVFTISDADQRITLFAVMLSAACVYLPHRLWNTRLRFVPPAATQITPYLLLMFLLFFPLHIYKNYEYLSYVRSHGGYLAIFTSQEHLSEIGLPIRIASQLCSAAFIAYFAYEVPRTRLWLVTAAYSAASVMELLIGLRGKVFLFMLGLIFLGKLKRGTRFRPQALLALAVVLMLVAEATAIFRENKSESLDASQSVQILLKTQGVSIDVLESVVAYRALFSRFVPSYLSHASALAFKGTDPLDGSSGLNFEDDLSYFLNPSGFILGFGTGGSFVAEGYLLGGLPGVAFESLIASALLAFCAYSLRGLALPFAWTLTTAIWYLPRQGLPVALSGTVKSCISLGLILIAACSFRALNVWWRYTLQSRKATIHIGDQAA